MTELALLISAAGSSLSAALLMGMARWLYRIDRRTHRNHETLHDSRQGPGIVSEVKTNTRALLRAGIRRGKRHDSD